MTPPPATITARTLGAIIREELANAGPTPDFDTVAKATVNRIDPADVADILLALVRREVTRVNTVTTAGAFCAPPRMQLPPAGPARNRAQLAWLNAIVCIDERDPASRKRLSACTLDDVQALITNRRTKAGELNAEADRYATLHKAMVAAKAATVAKLPAATLDALDRGWRS